MLCPKCPDLSILYQYDIDREDGFRTKRSPVSCHLYRALTECAAESLPVGRQGLGPPHINLHAATIDKLLHCPRSGYTGRDPVVAGGLGVPKNSTGTCLYWIYKNLCPLCARWIYPEHFLNSMSISPSKYC